MIACPAQRRRAGALLAAGAILLLWTAAASAQEAPHRLAATEGAWSTLPPLAGDDPATPLRGTTPLGTDYAIAFDGNRTLRIDLRGFHPKTVDDDMIALVLPGVGAGAPVSVRVLAMTIANPAGHEATYAPERPPDRPSQLSSLVSTIGRAFAVKVTGLIGDLPVGGLVWSPAPQSRDYRLRSVTVELTLPPRKRGHRAATRPPSPQQAERQRWLVANPSWIDAARESDPPLYDDHFPDWEFHRDRWRIDTWRHVTITERQLAIIDRGYLEAAGLPPDKADPARIRLFKDGREVPTLLMPDERVVFYATPSDSEYSLAATYWIDASGEAEPTRVEPAQPVTDPRPWTRRETALQEFTIDRDVFFTTSRDQFLTILDYRWVEREIPAKTPVTSEFDLPQFIPMGGRTKLRLGVYAVTARHDYTGNLEVSLNGQSIGATQFSGLNEIVVPFEFDATLLKPTRNIVEITDTLAIGHGARLYLDKILVTYTRDLYADTSPYEFSALPEPKGAPREFAVKALLSSGTNILALDIEDPARPKAVDVILEESTGDVLLRPAPGAGGHFFVFGDFDITEAPPARPVAFDPDLRATGLEVDHWIITHPDFLEAANKLAEHRAAQGYSVRIADLMAVYSEFSVGQTSPDAIRRFLAWQAGHAAMIPGSVLLIGDATHDYRGDFRNSVVNYLPSYRQADRPDLKEKYPVDLLFSCVLGSDLLADFTIARLSVNNATDAMNIVDKLIEYDEQPTIGPWRATAEIVADAGGFTRETEDIRTRQLPPGFASRTIYLEDFPWVDNYLFSREDQARTHSKISPDSSTRIREAFNEGLWVLSFWGHGSPNIWSTERMWFGGDSRNSDNLLLTNAPRLPLVLNMTCNTAAIDYPEAPWNVCLTEDMLRQRHGGALAIFAPGGMGFTAMHRKMSDAFLRALFDRRLARVGDIATLARWDYALHAYPDGILRMYILQGDPLSTLQRPEHELTVEASGRWQAPGAEPFLLGGTVPPALRAGLYRLVVYGPRGVRVHSEEGRLGTGLALDAQGRWRRALGSAPQQTGSYHASFYVWTDGSDGTAPTDGRGGVSWLVDKPIIALRDLFAENAGHAPGERSILGLNLANTSTLDALEVPLVVEEADAFARADSITWRTARTLLVDVPAGLVHRVAIEVDATHDVSLWRVRLLRHADVMPAALSQPPFFPLATTVCWNDRAPVGIHLIPALCGFDESPRVRDLVLRGRFMALCVPGGDESDRVVIMLDGDTKLTESPFAERTEAALLPASFGYSLDTRRTLNGHPILLEAGVTRATIPSAEERVASIVWKSSLAPDIAIESVTSRPERPTLGSSVFFDTVVRNRGGFPARGVVVSAYPGAEGQTASESSVRLPDRSERPAVPIAALLPGETAHFTTRWDPAEVPKGGAILLRAESTQGDAEHNVANNEARTTVDFRTNFDLQFVNEPTVAIETVDEKKPIVRLTTAVVNKGETAADRVEVNFFATQADFEDGKPPIAISDFDRIDPGQEVTAVYDWAVPTELARIGIRPVVSVNLRGSRQKVHSVDDLSTVMPVTFPEDLRQIPGRPEDGAAPKP